MVSTLVPTLSEQSSPLFQRSERRVELSQARDRFPIRAWIEGPMKLVSRGLKMKSQLQRDSKCGPHGIQTRGKGSGMLIVSRGRQAARNGIIPPRPTVAPQPGLISINEHHGWITVKLWELSAACLRKACLCVCVQS